MSTCMTTFARHATLELMDETLPSFAQDPDRASFESLIPGCRWRVVKPHHLPIEAGIRAEQARLTGKRWLVAGLLREFDGDCLTLDTVHLDAAFDVEGEALTRARSLQAEMMATMRAKLKDANCQSESPRWPLKEALSGRPVLHAGDTAYFHAPNLWFKAWVDVAVLPIDPASPLNVELIDAIGEPYDLGGLQGHFEKIGESLGVRAHSPQAMPPPTAPVPPQAPSHLNFDRPSFFWKLLSWLVPALGILAMIAGYPGVIGHHTQRHSAAPTEHR